MKVKFYNKCTLIHHPCIETMMNVVKRAFVKSDAPCDLDYCRQVINKTLADILNPDRESHYNIDVSSLSDNDIKEIEVELDKLFADLDIIRTPLTNLVELHVITDTGIAALILSESENINTHIAFHYYGESIPF